MKLPFFNPCRQGLQELLEHLSCFGPRGLQGITGVGFEDGSKNLTDVANERSFLRRPGSLESDPDALRASRGTRRIFGEGDALGSQQLVSFEGGRGDDRSCPLQAGEFPKLLPQFYLEGLMGARNRFGKVLSE